MLKFKSAYFFFLSGKGFLSGSIPALSNFDLKERDILQEASEITHAPLIGTAMV